MYLDPSDPVDIRQTPRRVVGQIHTQEIMGHAHNHLAYMPFQHTTTPVVDTCPVKSKPQQADKSISDVRRAVLNSLFKAIENGDIVSVAALTQTYSTVFDK